MVCNSTDVPSQVTLLVAPHTVWNGKGCSRYSLLLPYFPSFSFGGSILLLDFDIHRQCDFNLGVFNFKS